MSLLLLFPSGTGIVGWTPVARASVTWNTGAGSSSTWVITNWDYKNVWGEWEQTTWGEIEATLFTWDQMAGYTFTT